MTTGHPLPRLARPAAAFAAVLLLMAAPAGASAQTANQCAILINCTQPPISTGPLPRVAQSIPVTNGGFEDTAGGISPVSAMIQQHGWVRAGARRSSANRLQ